MWRVMHPLSQPIPNEEDLHKVSTDFEQDLQLLSEEEKQALQEEQSCL